MAMPNELLAAFEKTAYTAALPEGMIELRIGEPAPVLDALLREREHRCWAYVTAYNPGSTRDDAANPARHARLLAEVEKRGRPWFPGRAIAAGDWPAEESLLILGLEQNEAQALGRAYGQLAVVVGELGGAPLLLLCEGAEKP